MRLSHHFVSRNDMAMRLSHHFVHRNDMAMRLSRHFVLRNDTLLFNITTKSVNELLSKYIYPLFYRTALGGGRSFITKTPGGASIARGIVLTVKATVPISPWTPPMIF